MATQTRGQAKATKTAEVAGKTRLTRATAAAEESRAAAAAKATRATTAARATRATTAAKVTRTTAAAAATAADKPKAVRNAAATQKKKAGGGKRKKQPNKVNETPSMVQGKIQHLAQRECEDAAEHANNITPGGLFGKEQKKKGTSTVTTARGRKVVQERAASLSDDGDISGVEAQTDVERTVRKGRGRKGSIDIREAVQDLRQQWENIGDIEGSTMVIDDGDTSKQCTSRSQGKNNLEGIEGSEGGKEETAEEDGNDLDTENESTNEVAQEEAEKEGESEKDAGVEGNEEGNEDEERVVNEGITGDEGNETGEDEHSEDPGRSTEQEDVEMQTGELETEVEMEGQLIFFVY